MIMRIVLTVALLLLGIGLLVWLSERQEVRLAEIRNQARIALMDLMARKGDGDANPLDLFRSSIADPTHAKATFRRTVYIPAYSAIRVMSGLTSVMGGFLLEREKCPASAGRPVRERNGYRKSRSRALGLWASSGTL